jgi:hypothetical protein
MNEVEYAEKITADALQQARHAYDMLYDRVYRFSTLVAGGGGAMGTYAFGKMGDTQTSPQWIALLTVSGWLFFLSGFAIWFGTSSNTLTVGTLAKAIRARLSAHESNSTGITLREDEPDRAKFDARQQALWLTRWDNLAAVDEQIVSVSKATSRRAKSLDLSHKMLMATPAIAIAAYWAARTC